MIDLKYFFNSFLFKFSQSFKSNSLQSERIGAEVGVVILSSSELGGGGKSSDLLFFVTLKSKLGTDNCFFASSFFFLNYNN